MGRKGTYVESQHYDRFLLKVLQKFGLIILSFYKTFKFKNKKKKKNPKFKIQNFIHLRRAPDDPPSLASKIWSRYLGVDYIDYTQKRILSRSQTVPNRKGRNPDIASPTNSHIHPHFIQLFIHTTPVPHTSATSCPPSDPDRRDLPPSDPRPRTGLHHFQTEPASLASLPWKLS